MVKSIFIFLFFHFWVNSFTQIFIGSSKEEIIKIMNEKNPGFNLDEGAVNNTYKYLKYVDKNNEETWLFFLSDDNICTRTKLMSDFSNLQTRKDELDKEYKSSGENKWTFINNGTTYIIELKKEEWFFTITTKKKD
jgi:hypothetical protein